MNWNQSLERLAEQADKKLIDRADAHAGLRQLTRLVGMQSVKAGTDYEAEELANEAEDIREEVYGKKKEKKGSEEQDDMRDILATGPVYINSPQTEETTTEQQQPEEPKQPEPVKPEPEPPRPEQPKQLSKPLAWGLGVAAALAAISLPILAWNLSSAAGPSKPTPTEDVKLGARFVPLPPELQQ